MLKQLRVIAALTEPNEALKPIQEEQKDEYIKQLESRLRVANQTAIQLMKRLQNVSYDQESVDSIKLALTTALEQLRPEEAKAYLVSEFTPDRLKQIDAVSVEAGQAIRETITEYSKSNAIALFYQDWV